MKKTGTVLLVIGIAASAMAEVVLPKVISDKMILQRGVEAPVWGWADPGEKVTVSFAGQTKKAMPDANGKWMVKLDPLNASSENRTMTIKGSNEIRVKDVLVGEVWLASGQSNMEWDFMRIDKEEKAFAARHKDNKLVRAFHVNAHITAPMPLDDTVGWWKDAEEMVGEPGISLGLQKGVSAVGFFFALKLQQELGVPVAFIDANWGGRRIESFISGEGYDALGLEYRKGGTLKAGDVADKIEAKLGELSAVLEEAEQGKEISANVLGSFGIRAKESRKLNAVMEKNLLELQDDLTVALETAKQGRFIPVNLSRFLGVADNDIYNAMIAPLTPYAIKGAIWYQGESNRKSTDYFEKLQALSTGWSQAFHVKDIPLHLVQIAPYDYEKKRGTNEPGPLSSILADNIWQTQYRGAEEIPGMSVVPIHDTDIPVNNIHPPHKLPVGNRLAARALKEQYGKDIAAEGPSFAGAKRKGSAVVVAFNNIDQGLGTKDGAAPTWFELSADGENFVSANAAIKGNTVEVNAADVASPKFVRMGWYDTAIPTLQDKNGWPVLAFPAQPVK
jgi:sialate O-acetylesterase